VCGIVGYAGTRQVVPLLLEGLERLEYRGYDSAGVAVMSDDGELSVRKTKGRLSQLAESLQNGHMIEGNVGIGHTRWATHGRPSDENAHPHTDCSGRICVVHNGIVENHEQLRRELEATGHHMVSETDTEVIAHLIEAELALTDGYSPTSDRLLTAARRALDKIRGLYAVGVLWLDTPDVIVGARRRAPLIVGLADHGVFLASDIPAVLGQTRSIIRLDEGDLVAIHPDGVQVVDENGEAKNTTPEAIDWDVASAEKEGYPHFFLKETHEQPEALERTLSGRLADGRVELAELAVLDVQRVKRVVLTGCGSAFHACLMAQYFLEDWLRVPVDTAIGSELRYRKAFLDDSVLYVAVSQSGETADTLAALEEARDAGAQRIAVTNVVGSAITTLADAVLLQHSGPEIAVVSSKSFTGQVATLLLAGLWLADARGTLKPDSRQTLVNGLAELPALLRRVLSSTNQIARVGESCSHLDRLLFLGRGIGYPMALEGALKLKEISYIQAEGYAAGELKHGPLALVDENTTVLVVATRSETLDKLLSNVEEVRARGGRIIAIASEGDDRVPAHADEVIWVPATLEALSPLVNVVPMQLLAYHAAVARGCDVDKPRNLAKSVTVE
jgi:glutamine---fructose-6-phosphate transaminase (isomerizing)